MKLVFLFMICLAGVNVYAGINDSLQWIKKESPSFTLYYTPADSSIILTLEKDLRNGNRTVTGFFKTKSFKKKFDVYIFPNRAELNKQWQKDWGMPGFKSECWMVASGVAHRLDILSPLCWKKEACDHNAGDSTEVQKIITHELVHVFHAQHNPNPTFDGMDELSWFVEGLATYASGQLSKERISRVREQFKQEKIPLTLTRLWTGSDKYGRAGSFVQFIDKEFGRKKLVKLLEYTDNSSILKTLHRGEAELISKWKNVGF
jgi:hypothetical protein